jgi:uracil-DNA glycosylase
VLPLGLPATASCLEVAFARAPPPLDAVVGTAWEWAAPWGPCGVLPLYHPSPANAARWPRNRRSRQRFGRERSAFVPPLPPR